MKKTEQEENKKINDISHSFVRARTHMYANVQEANTHTQRGRETQTQTNSYTHFENVRA